MREGAASPFDLSLLGGHSAVAALVAEVRAAGRLALDLYAKGAANRAVRKPDRSPVTEADRAVEDHLRSHMARAFPGIGFLGEETGEENAEAELRFVVDPIDGTRSFLRGIPTWSILVGLEHRRVPVLGVAHFPADGDMLVGIQGHGATSEDARGTRTPLRVSEVDSLEHAVISHGSLLQFTGSGHDALLTALGNETYTQRGFTDFDGYRKLLHGQVDAMLEPGIQAWDICPAAVLVREAGGRFTSFSGRDTVHEGTSIASNGRIHDALLALVARAGDAARGNVAAP